MVAAPVGIAIRQLGRADADLYRPVRLRAVREEPTAFGSAYEDEVDRPVSMTAERLANPDGVTLGAFDGDALVGVVTCIHATGRKMRHRANIYAMYVAPEARGRGVGRALLTEAIARARAWDGVDLVLLTVSAINEPARRLYDSLGFVTYGVEPRALRVDGRDVDEELMALDLRG
jgi:ribosomal protein S18 acetylase RimI-like enzyme